ncbi:MAG: hypothetical protein Q7R76_02775 [Candidatus Woesearchaeota archaeon]|nr:hypothetical protein [Candidatus Woesearchaeota archaeon]
MVVAGADEGDDIPIEIDMAEFDAASSVQAPPIPNASFASFSVTHFFRLAVLYGYPSDAEKLGRLKDSEPAARDYFLNNAPGAAYFQGKIFDLPEFVERGRSAFTHPPDRTTINGARGAGARSWLMTAYWLAEYAGDDELRQQIGSPALERVPYLAYKIGRQTRNESLANTARGHITDTDPLFGIILGMIEDDDGLLRACAGNYIPPNARFVSDVAKRRGYHELTERVNDYLFTAVEQGLPLGDKKTIQTVDYLVELFNA